MKEIFPQKALNHFVPIPCVFVISVDEKERPNGMIASWVMQTSFVPPLFAVSIGKTRHTLNLIKRSKEFVIAVSNKKLERVVRVFGSKSGKDLDKFNKTGVKTKKAKFVKSPLLAEATINFECKVVKEVDSGDHVIFIGQVLTAWENEGKKVLLNMGRVEGKRIFEEF